MTPGEAIAIVLELAEQNMLTMRETRQEPQLYDEMIRQGEAIELVKAYSIMFTGLRDER